MKNLKNLILLCLLALLFVPIAAQTPQLDLMMAMESSDASFRAARKHLSQQNFAGAVAELDKILQKSPNNSDALFLRALAYYNLKKYEQSLADANKIIAAKNSGFDYTKAEAYALRATVYLDRNNRRAAISDAITALATDPRVDQTYRLLKTLLTPEQFAAELSKVIVSTEKSPNAYSQLYAERAYQYYLLKQYDLAAADSVKALQRDRSEKLDAQPIWGFLDNHYKDKPDLYVAELTKIIDYRYSNPLQALARRAYIYFDQSKFDLTIADATNAIRRLNAAQLQGREGASFHSLRAHAYAHSGKTDLALADLNKVLATKFYQAADYDLRAQIYCYAGKKVEAKADEKKIAELGSKPSRPCQ